MTWVVMIISLLVSGLLQSRLPAIVWLGQAKVPVLLAVVTYYALCRQSDVALTAAFLAGLLYDALSPVPLGYSAFCLCLLTWLAGRFQDLVLPDSVVTQAFFGAVGGVALALASYLLLMRAGLLQYPVGRALLRTAGTGLLAMVCTPVVCFVMSALDRLLGNVQVRESINGFE